MDELGLYKFVEYFHVFLRVTCDTARGLQYRKRPANDGWGENCLATHSFKPRMMHVINLFAPFPVVQQKHVEGNTRCIGFHCLFIWSHICHGRNCELLNSTMINICTRNRNRPSSEMQNVLGRTKPPEQKDSNFKGAWRMRTK